MTSSPSVARAGITRFAHRGSARLAYEPVGDANDAARTLVLLHDLLEDRSVFARWRTALVAEDDPAPLRLILPDARGHGASATPGNQRLSLPDLAADLLAILDAEKTSRPHLVGRGFGGAIAFALARGAPDRVASLVVIEPALPGVLASDPDAAARDVAAGVRDHWRSVSDTAIRGQTDQALDRLLTTTLGAAWRAHLPRPRQAAIRRHAGALGALLAALNAEEPSHAEIQAIACPTLIIQTGGADPLDRHIAARLLATMPSARLETVAGGTDAADDVLATIVREFIANVDP